MNSFKNIFTTLILSFVFVSFALGQSKKPVTTSFWVGGVCEMCEKRIEKTLDVPGVLFADYTVDNHTLEITYKPNKISEEKIHKLLNEVGHDTEKSMASDEQYDKIHHCCKYREHEHNH